MLGFREIAQLAMQQPLGLGKGGDADVVCAEELHRDSASFGVFVRSLTIFDLFGVLLGLGDALAEGDGPRILAMS